MILICFSQREPKDNDPAGITSCRFFSRWRFLYAAGSGIKSVLFADNTKKTGQEQIL